MENDILKVEREQRLDERAFHQEILIYYTLVSYRAALPPSPWHGEAKRVTLTLRKGT